MKILIIEDELALLQDIKAYLESENYVVETATVYQEADWKISGYEYDCIVVDINLPGGSGFDIIKGLKEIKSSAGIIIISARNSIDDKLKGLEIGSDDYLVKPFHLSELNARIKAVFRRRNLAGNNVTVFNEIVVNHTSGTVEVSGNALTLTQKEFDMLVYFIVNKNKVLSQASIVEHLWEDKIELAGTYSFLYTHVRNLRKKLMDSGSTNYLKSIYGIGYKWEGQ